jgi:Pyroglutamyl peptidase
MLPTIASSSFYASFAMLLTLITLVCCPPCCMCGIATLAAGCLQDKGHGAEPSSNAGRYLCNYLYFKSLRNIQQHRQASWHAMFLHVPSLEVASFSSHCNLVSHLVQLLQQQLSLRLPAREQQPLSPLQQPLNPPQHHCALTGEGLVQEPAAILSLSTKPEVGALALKAGPLSLAYV